VKVLFQIRQGYEKGAAGDSMQMLKTMQHLAQMGVGVSISASAGEDLKKYDIVHIFNVTRINESYAFYKNAAAQKKKIVVSPIFVDMGRYLGSIGAVRLAAWRSANLLGREVLAGASMLLPNSQLEAEWIQKILCVDTPCQVIHNGVDGYMAEGDGQKFTARYGLKDFLLCVGRLSPIKNQLGLIRAVRDLHLPLVLIGPVNDFKYAKRCAEEGMGLVKYLPGMSHRELANAYKASALHIQPSFFETAGLSGLEAAAAGTRVVASNRGAAREYFGDLVSYVDPYDEESIRRTVEETLKRPFPDELKRHVLDSFTWADAAEKTLKAYRAVLEGPSDAPGRSEILFTSEYNLSCGKEPFRSGSGGSSGALPADG